jgi:hypothetical protein
MTHLKTMLAPTQIDARIEALHPLPDNRIEVIFRAGSPRKAPPAFVRIITPIANFEKRVTLYGRSTGGPWKSLVSEARIFDYARFMDVRNTRIPLPGRAPYPEYRLVLEDVSDIRQSNAVRLARRLRRGAVWEETADAILHRRDFRIDRIQLGWYTRRPVRRTDVLRQYPAPGLSIEEDGRKRTTILNFHCRREPLCRIRVLTESDNFSRAVTILAPDEKEGGRHARVLASGRITRIHLGNVTRDDTSIDFPASRFPAYRVVIANGDNPPLPIRGVEAFGQVFQAVFVARPGKQYRLYYGAPEAAPPKYDAETVLKPVLDAGEADPPELPLGPERTNPDFRRRFSWNRFVSSRGFLGTVLVAAVIFLGWVLFHAIQQVELEEEVLGVPPAPKNTAAKDSEGKQELPHE